MARNRETIERWRLVLTAHFMQFVLNRFRTVRHFFPQSVNRYIGGKTRRAWALHDERRYHKR